MRLLWLFLGLAILVLVGFATFGGHFDQQFTVDGSVAWLRGKGNWSAMAAIGLLASDLLLPIPSTMIFTALGILYGPWLGGLVGTLGFTAGGLMGYGACRASGERVVRRLLGERDFERGKSLFAKSGGWIVAASRWLPVLPEVISCIAGLTRMPFPRFLTALVCGSAPPAFAFAFLGHAGSENPAVALGISAVSAPLLWWVIGRRLK